LISPRIIPEMNLQMTLSELLKIIKIQRIW
jgi:hypothetical protein